MIGKFVKRVLCFVFPMVLLAVCGEVYMRSIPNIYRYKDRWMSAHAAELDLLILGNSHMFDGINPSWLSAGNAFNLALPNQKPEHDYYLLTKYAPLYKRLTTVIVPLEETSLVLPDLETHFLGNRATYYRIYMGYDRQSPFSPRSYEVSNPLMCLTKLGRYWHDKLDGEGGVSCDSLGFMSLQDTIQGTPDLSSLAWLNTLWQDTAVVQRHVESFKSMVRFTREHNLRLVLVTSPVTRPYGEAIAPQLTELLQATARELTRDNHVVYLNYRDSCFTNDEFYDNSHLNEGGARHWTRMVNDELLKLDK